MPPSLRMSSKEEEDHHHNYHQQNQQDHDDQHHVASLDESLGSVCSLHSVASATGSVHSTCSMPSLSSNLMRTQCRGRDPYQIYESIKLIGAGSMGTVHWVKKRPHAMGGSARPSFVDAVQRSNRPLLQKCVGSVCGGEATGLLDWLLSLLPRKDDAMTEDIDDKNSASARRRRMYRTQSSLVKYDDDDETHTNHNSKRSTCNYYALKSLHLECCSTREYVDELKVCMDTRAFVNLRQSQKYVDAHTAMSYRMKFPYSKHWITPTLSKPWKPTTIAINSTWCWNCVREATCTRVNPIPNRRSNPLPDRSFPPFRTCTVVGLFIVI